MFLVYFPLLRDIQIFATIMSTGGVCISCLVMLSVLNINFHFIKDIQAITELIHDGKLNRKRSRLETIYTILTLSRRGIRKTHIMYRANLSHQQLVKYLEVLTTKNLLAEREGSFITTVQGVAFIEKFQEIQTIMDENWQQASSSNLT